MLLPLIVFALHIAASTNYISEIFVWSLRDTVRLRSKYTFYLFSSVWHNDASVNTVENNIV